MGLRNLALRLGVPHRAAERWRRVGGGQRVLRRVDLDRHGLRLLRDRRSGLGTELGAQEFVEPFRARLRLVAELRERLRADLARAGLAVTVLAVNLLGDGLRYRLDPRLARRL